MLKAAEAAEFEVLVTADQNISHQQNVKDRALGLIVLGNLSVCRIPFAAKTKPTSRTPPLKVADNKLRKKQEPVSIALTLDVKETSHPRAQRHAEFRHSLLSEAAEAVMDGDLPTVEAVLLYYVQPFTKPS